MQVPSGRQDGPTRRSDEYVASRDWASPDHHPRTRNAPLPMPPTSVQVALPLPRRHRTAQIDQPTRDRANSSIPRFLCPPIREDDDDHRDDVSYAVLSLEAKQAYSRYRICYLTQINRHYFVIWWQKRPTNREMIQVLTLFRCLCLDVSVIKDFM